MKTTSILGLAAGAAALLLAGCASQAPNLDARFGASVSAARAAQIIDPAAGARAGAVNGIDGVAAVNAMERYRTSFKNPPEPVNVFNVGVGSTGGGR